MVHRTGRPERLLRPGSLTWRACWVVVLIVHICCVDDRHLTVSQVDLLGLLFLYSVDSCHDLLLLRNYLFLGQRRFEACVLHNLRFFDNVEFFAWR